MDEGLKSYLQNMEQRPGQGLHESAQQLVGQVD